jgi:hypothetical protein
VLVGSAMLESARRHERAFRGHDGLHKYLGNARYRAVDAHDGWNAGDVVNRPNNMPRMERMGHPDRTLPSVGIRST